VTGTSIERSPLGRNFFDAGHNCPESENFEAFRVWIGSPAVCPKCKIALEVEAVITICEKERLEEPVGQLVSKERGR